jgi:hypothetical protein
MREPTPLTIGVFEFVRILEAVTIRKFEDGFMVGETKSKEKISGETKRLAHEMLTIDRSDPAKTVKYHRVQEFDEDGNPVGELHEHTRISLSKRRPSKSKS